MAYLTFTAFFAESFIFTHLHHEHDRNGTHGSCSVCNEIERDQLILESLGRIGIAACLAGFIAHAKKQIKKHSLLDHTVMTPIALKVRLNT
jgi:hypothetical protein